MGTNKKLNYKVLKTEKVYSGYFSLEKTEVKHEKFNGEWVEKTLEVFERGNSVAILLKERDSNSFLFTKQFRYPTTKNDNGWILEIPAGSLQEGELPEICVKREVEEELGYLIGKNIQLITKFYSSPGACSEMIYLYYAEVVQNDKQKEGGGLASEKEDIQLVKIDVKELHRNLYNSINDAKSILALQWFFLKKQKNKS